MLSVINSSTTLTALLQNGKELFEQGNKKEALHCYEQALGIEPANETAIMWCATLTEDPFVARNLLNTLLGIQPENEAARVFYKVIQNQCMELEKTPYENDFNEYWEKYQGEKGVPPLGQYLLRAGQLSEVQLTTSLTFQKYLYANGGSKKLGEILMSFGYITGKQLNDALEKQNREFMAQRLKEIDAVGMVPQITVTA